MAAGGRYEFGHYRLDVRAHLLFRNGRRVVLTPKAVDLLAALVEAQGEPVGKQELLHRVWPDAVVEEGSLTSHISLLRRVLAEGAGGRQFIETLQKRGYRFVGPCAAMAQPAAATGAARPHRQGAPRHLPRHAGTAAAAAVGCDTMVESSPCG